jgi:predicted MFS family arabinose efflux permease
LPRQVWVLAACLLVNRLGMMVLPFLELYLTEGLGLGVAAGGRIVAAYGIGSILGIAAGAWCTDRFGPWRVQVASLVLSALCLLVLWRARSAAALAAAVAAVGMASDAFRPANGAAIAHATRPEVRARSFSLMSLAINLGLSLGLPLGGLLAQVDYAWLFWIDASTALAAALVLLAFGGRGAPAEGSRPEARAPVPSPWRDRTYVLAVALMTVAAAILFQFFGALPVFLKRDLGFDEGGVGLALGLNTVVAAAFGMLAVRWAERGDDLVWIARGSLLIALGYSLNALGESTALALASILVWSVGEMFFFPFTAAFASHRAPPSAAGRYLGLYHQGFAVAFVLAPLAGTQLYASLGPRGLWIACALTGVALHAAFGLLARRRA